jgi:cold shock CspA family protein
MATDDVTFFSEQRGFGLVRRDVGGSASVHFFSLNAIGYRALPDDEGFEFTFRPRVAVAHREAG